MDDGPEMLDDDLKVMEDDNLNKIPSGEYLAA